MSSVTPQWDLSPEYPSPDSPLVQEELGWFQKRIPEITSMCKGLEGGQTSRLAEVATASEEFATRLGSLELYAHCEHAVDTKNTAAGALITKTTEIEAQLEQALAQYRDVMMRSTDEELGAFLKERPTEEFYWKWQRRLKHRILPPDQERSISALRVNGLKAWGELYTNLTGQIKCSIEFPNGETKTLGVAQARALIHDPDGRVRKAAALGMDEAFRGESTALASCLNAIAGWTLDEGKQRQGAPFLESPLQASHMGEDTLDALMGVVGQQGKALSTRASTLKARLAGREQLETWDKMMPAPVEGEEKTYPYAQGLDLVARAYEQVHPELGKFIHHLQEEKRIEGRDTATKRPGAFCGTFEKSRKPYVFMTYKDSMKDVFTLAHECGHAFHGHLLRDMAFHENRYPMTLAETASTFGETALMDLLVQEADSKTQKQVVGFTQATNAELYLSGVASRFWFEKELYQRRSKGPLTADELCEMSLRTQNESWGDTYKGHSEMDWAKVLHYYIAGFPFYNYPYSFGYLFSLGVYAQREKLGDGFYEAYCSLLRDTGRMTCEELAQKHLGADLTKPDFWLESLGVVSKQMDAFEANL